MRVGWNVLFIVVVTVTVGCKGSLEIEEPDGATPNADAGVLDPFTDAGARGRDWRDAGEMTIPPLDAGSPSADSGIIDPGTSDSGTVTPEDAATASPDSGVPADGSGPCAGGRPGPTNTGPNNPTALRRMDGLTITTDGTVLENVDISGQLRIDADNVTVRNFRVTTGTWHAVYIERGHHGIVFEDGEITGMNSSAIFGGGYVARRLNLHNSGADGIKPDGDVVLECSWLHDLGYIEGSHSDGVQMRAGSGLTLRGNNFDMVAGHDGFGNTICILVQTGDGPIDDVLIERNWINGGGVSIQIRDQGNGPVTAARILNNRFGRDAVFGLFALDGEVTVSGNVWDDSGAPAP